MEPAKRQLVHLLLLLLLLNSVTVVAAFLQHFYVMSAGQPLVQQALTTLVSGPLSGHDLLLVTDNHTQGLLDLDQVVEAVGTSLTPVLLATQHSFLHTHRPAHHTKGSLLTALLLFHQDPTDFLFLLADNTNWNPSYLVLFCLNPHLNTTTVLSQPVVQRSHFIFLLQPAFKASRKYLFAFTSLPLLHSARGSPLTKAPMGMWNPNNFLSRLSLFPFRFYDFGGKVLQVPTQCYDEPFMYADVNGEYGSCIGMNVDALHIIGDKLNFKFAMRSDPVASWGNKINGTWYGMLGELMYDGKDIFINEMQNKPDRASDFDFIYPYWETDFAFMLLKPPPLPQWKNVLYPFSTLMWCLVLATTLTSAALLAFLLHHITNIPDPIGIALKITAGLLNQSVGFDAVQVWWARVWLVTWWLAVDILAAAYTSNLITLLTVPVFPPVLKTVQELLATDIKPSMLDYGGFVPEALKTSSNPTLKTLGDKLYLDPTLVYEDPYKAILKKVFKGTHALLIVGDYLRFIQHKKNLTRTTYLMDETIYRSYAYWFLPRNTAFTPTISFQLQRLLETGILAKLYRLHVGYFLKKEKQVPGDGVLDLDHLQGAFILLGVGLVAAILVQLQESYRFYHRDQLNSIN